MSEKNITNETTEFISTNVNPFALAELVSGKKINWSLYKDETQALCEILNVKKEELFAPDSPILHPFHKISEDGSITKLSDEKAMERLEAFLKPRTYRRITKQPPMRRLRLKNIRADVPELLFSMRNLKVPATKTPVAATTYTWADMDGEYFKEVPSFDDPVQGNLADCYLFAAMTSVVWTRPYAISNMAKPSANGNDDRPLHKFFFYNNNKEESVVTDETVKVKVSNGKKVYCYGRSNDQGETWPSVLEKAYAKWRTNAKNDRPDMSKIEYYSPYTACCQLVGGTSSVKYHSSTSAKDLLKFVKTYSAGNKAFDPMCALTPKVPPTGLTDRDYTNEGIVLNHAYSILGWDSRNGKDYIILRNPWGHKVANTDTLSGTYAYYYDGVKKYLTYGANGVFALEANAFKRFFSSCGVVLNDLYKTKGK